MGGDLVRVAATFPGQRVLDGHRVLLDHQVPESLFVVQRRVQRAGESRDLVVQVILAE